MLSEDERQAIRERATATGWESPAVLALLSELGAKDAEIARLREALESIWGQWAAGNASAERAMEAIRELIYGEGHENAPAPPALALTAEEAWARDKHVVRKAVHEAGMAEKQRQGFADHPWPLVGPPGEKYPWDERRGPCWLCTGPGESRPDRAHHHPDMLPYEDLSPENQAYDYASGEVAYLLGFAARAKLAADGERT